MRFWSYAGILFLLVLMPRLGQAQAFCVKKDGTKLKESPKTSAATMTTVGRYMPLQGTGNTKPKWVEVADFENKVYWVLRKQVTTGVKCLVVRSKTTKIRTGPGSNFPPAELGTVSKTQAFKDLSGEDGWNRIESATGETGWVNLNHVWQPINHKYRMSFEHDQ